MPRGGGDAVDPVHGLVRDYYEAKVRRHGATPRGVDWESEPMQQLRFVQLLKLIDFERPFSLTELGCGYGALLPFIRGRHPRAVFGYAGIDLAPGMIRRARRLHRDAGNATFRIGSAPLEPSDYCIASGIFNVELDVARDAWEAMIERTLRDMSRAATRGFAFNLMAAWPGPEAPAQLYRCLPQRWLGFCERELGAKVELLDRYKMREFTILARKPG
jgi:SAM-dependent methyltransferase